MPEQTLGGIPLGLGIAMKINFFLIFMQCIVIIKSLPQGIALQFSWTYDTINTLTISVYT